MNKSILVKKLADFFLAIAERRHIDLAFLYGSWAAGKQCKGSDIDIAILFSDGARSEYDMYQAMVDISEELSDVLGSEINIIRLRQDFDKPMLYYNAVVHGVPLYIKGRRFYFRFLREAVSQMEDFCIFGITWQLMAARRNLKGITNA